MAKHFNDTFWVAKSKKKVDKKLKELTTKKRENTLGEVFNGNPVFENGEKTLFFCFGLKFFFFLLTLNFAKFKTTTVIKHGEIRHNIVWPRSKKSDWVNSFFYALQQLL